MNTNVALGDFQKKFDETKDAIIDIVTATTDESFNGKPYDARAYLEEQFSKPNLSKILFKLSNQELLDTTVLFYNDEKGEGDTYAQLAERLLVLHFALLKARCALPEDDVLKQVSNKVYDAILDLPSQKSKWGRLVTLTNVSKCIFGSHLDKIFKSLDALCVVDKPEVLFPLRAAIELITGIKIAKKARGGNFVPKLNQEQKKCLEKIEKKLEGMKSFQLEKEEKVDESKEIGSNDSDSVDSFYTVDGFDDQGDDEDDQKLEAKTYFETAFETTSSVISAVKNSIFQMYSSYQREEVSQAERDKQFNLEKRSYGSSIDSGGLSEINLEGWEEKSEISYDDHDIKAREQMSDQDLNLIGSRIAACGVIVESLDEALICSKNLERKGFLGNLKNKFESFKLQYEGLKDGSDQDLLSQIDSEIIQETSACLKGLRDLTYRFNHDDPALVQFHQLIVNFFNWIKTVFNKSSLSKVVKVSHYAQEIFSSDNSDEQGFTQRMQANLN